MEPAAQKALIQSWAAETTYVNDLDTSPKADFARLAKAKGWIGGDTQWCSHWKECFGETYPFGGTHQEKSTSINTKATKDASDLVDRMRRLSVGSNASSFSVVSRTSHARSFGSVRSLDSAHSRESAQPQQDVDSETRVASQAPEKKQSKGSRRRAAKQARKLMENWAINDSCESVLSPESMESLDSIVGGVNVLNIQDTSLQRDDKGEAYSWDPWRSGIWYTFEGFEPSLTTPFRTEFNRLAIHEGWGGVKKREQFITLLNAEVDRHFYAFRDKLEMWQELCQELGTEYVPTSLNQCKKVLKTVKINLFSLIDHKRDPTRSIKQYWSYAELRRSIKNGNKFPKQCAKVHPGVLAVFLHKL